MLSATHRNYLITEIMRGIEAIGLSFEAYGNRLADLIAGQQLVHRGSSPAGNPVGHVLDSMSSDGTLAAEYSSQGNYFDDPYKKLISDIDHCVKIGPTVRQLLLISSRECGPKAHTELTKQFADYQKNSNLRIELYDSRRQAEHIVDIVLLNDAATDELAQYIAPLDRIRSEYAATHTLPLQSAAYITQPPMESAIKSKLQADRACVIAGMSGSGKTEMALAVAHACRSGYELVVWISASQLTSLNDLRAIDMERRGHRINLQHLLQHRSCLLTLDDLRLATTTEALRDLCGPRSSLLVTRQHAVGGDLQIQMLNEADARRLLEYDLKTPCPDEVFNEVWGTVGGHPFTLRLMNAGVRNGSWDELVDDCKTIGQYADAERAQKLTDRLLGRQIPQLGRELAFFVWAGTSRADRSFARWALSPVGLRNLESHCFLASDRGDVLRLHDIVFAALGSQALPVKEYAGQFNKAMDKYVQSLAFTPGTDLQFLTFCELHKPLLVRELSSDPTRSECLFCLSQSAREDDSLIALIGNPVERARSLLAKPNISDIDVSAICEAIEALYRGAKTAGGTTAARDELSSNIEALELLIGSKRLSKAALRTAQHHKAKAFRNLEKFDEAIALCEHILDSSDSMATRLLLARLVTSAGDAGAARAKDILFDILDTASQDQALVPLSVTLAAIEALARKELKDWQRDAMERFGETVATLIVDAAARGFDHAFVSFAAIGRDLKYNNQELFIRVFEQLPRRMPSVSDDDRELGAWASILLSAADIPSLNQSGELSTEAEQFFDAIKKPDNFVLQQHGQLLVKAGRYQEAAEKLRPLVTPTSKPYSRYWLSKAELALGDQPTALKLINEALEHPEAKRYKSSFLEHRAEVRKSDPAAQLEDLLAAYEACENGTYKASLLSKIENHPRYSSPLMPVAPSASPPPGPRSPS